MAFQTQRLSFSSLEIHIIINMFLCLLIASFFNVSFDWDDQRLFFFTGSLHFLQLIVFRIKVISQQYSIFESNNLITRIVFIGLVISLVVFGVIFPLSFIIGLFISIGNYIILLIIYLLIVAVIFQISIFIYQDSRLFRLVNYLSRFAVRKIPEIMSFINSILGSQYFSVRSFFVLLISSLMLINTIASLFILLILSVILHDGNNLTAANIMLYLLAFYMIVSVIRIFIEITLSLEANKLYRQGSQLFKQEIKTSKIQTISIFEQALLLYQKTNYQIWAAITLNNIGLVYDTLEEKQTALDYFNQSLDLFKKMQSVLGQTMILNNIGLVYNTLEKKRTALDYFNQSLDLSQKIQDKGSVANTLYNLAVLKYNQGDLYEALTKIESAIKIIEEIYTEIIITNLPQSDFTTIQNYYQFYIELLITLHKQNPNQGYDIKANEVREKLKNRERNLTIISPYL
ncbi:MAG: tetratricopeptide repeat protein [Okeania sp. SIO2D1]|nr:tetratricopeptide repeat protein [Okeania sp. SIO2D1]